MRFGFEAYGIDIDLCVLSCVVTNPSPSTDVIKPLLRGEAIFKYLLIFCYIYVKIRYSPHNQLICRSGANNPLKLGFFKFVIRTSTFRLGDSTSNLNDNI